MSAVDIMKCSFLNTMIWNRAFRQQCNSSDHDDMWALLAQESLWSVQFHLDSVSFPPSYFPPSSWFQLESPSFRPFVQNQRPSNDSQSAYCLLSVSSPTFRVSCRVATRSYIYPLFSLMDLRLPLKARDAPASLIIDPSADFSVACPAVITPKGGLCRYPRAGLTIMMIALYYIWTHSAFADNPPCHS